MKDLKHKKEKEYIFPDGKLLYIKKMDLKYRFALFTSQGEVLYNGILETKSEDVKEIDILKELFGYFDISEDKIGLLKECNIIIKPREQMIIKEIE